MEQVIEKERVTWESEERWVLAFCEKQAWKVFKQGMEYFDLYQELAMVFLKCLQAQPDIERDLFQRYFRRACHNKVIDLAGKTSRRVFQREFVWFNELGDLKGLENQSGKKRLMKMTKVITESDNAFLEVDLKLDCASAWAWLRKDLLKALQGIKLDGRKYARKRKEAQKWCREVLELSPT